MAKRTDVQKLMAAERRRAISVIRKLVRPHFRDSGYVRWDGPRFSSDSTNRRLRMWAPDEPVSIRGYALTDVLAITEDGLMTDAHGGGCIISGWAFPLEDLLRLQRWVEKRFAPTAVQHVDAARAEGREGV